MSKALPGEHYCLEHQGNHSHYDPKNCTVCTLTRRVTALESENASLRLDLKIADAMGHDVDEKMHHALVEIRKCQRYDIFDEAMGHEQKSDDGEWVKFSDIEKPLKVLEKL